MHDQRTLARVCVGMMSFPPRRELAMNDPGTRRTGPLGSTIHVLRAEAEGVRFSLTDEESREAVARVVRRRQRASVRVREEEEAYSQYSHEPAATD